MGKGSQGEKSASIVGSYGGEQGKSNCTLKEGVKGFGPAVLGFELERGKDT